MKLHVLGIDLGKTVFHLVGLDSTGKVVIRKKCARRQLLAFTANLQVELIRECCIDRLNWQDFPGLGKGIVSELFATQRCRIRPIEGEYVH